MLSTNMALGNKNLLIKILLYSDFESTMSLKKSKRSIKSKLNAQKNEDMNNLCLYHYMAIFRNKDDDEDFDIKIGEIMYDTNIETKRINWEKKMKEINEHLEKMEFLLDDKINEVIDFIFKYHTYLPDLRKNNVHLEFSNSSIFMLKLYDFNKFQKIQDNYYEKYITEEYMSDSAGIKKIVPLREKQYYEKELLNLRESFQEIKGNERYIKILKEQIMEYNYTLLEKEFKRMKKENLEKINPIICFTWIITVYFRMYLDNVKASILRFKNDIIKEKYLKEFIKQHNNVMNVILFIDSNFNNVNIILNYWSKFLNKDNKEKSEKKFSLLILLLNMYKDKVYNTIIYDVLDQLKKYIEENSKKEEDKMIIKNDKDDEDLNSTNEDSSCLSDEECKSESEYEDTSVKSIIEEIGNCILDIELNPQNSNGINHTGIKLGEIYEKYEDILKEAMERYLKENLEEKDPLKTFEELKSLLEADKNPRSLIYKNYKLINRIKKKLTNSFIKLFVPYITKKFDIKNKYYKYDSHQENFDDFSEESEIKIKKKVENEIKQIKKMLIDNALKLEGLSNVQVPKDLEDMVNNYVDKNGDSIVILAKKVIYFYFKEMQFYEDNDKKVIRMLKGLNPDSDCSFIDEKN